MITSFDIEVVNCLLNYCKRNKIENKFTLSSCLVYRNKKYGLSINDYFSSNPLTRKYNYPNNTQHTESATIYKASKLLNVSKFKQSTLVVVGVGRSSNCNLLKSSKPCKYCYNVITNFNCGRLIYLTSKDNKELVIKEEILNGS